MHIHVHFSDLDYLHVLLRIALFKTETFQRHTIFEANANNDFYICTKIIEKYLYHQFLNSFGNHPIIN